MLLVYQSNQNRFNSKVVGFLIFLLCLTEIYYLQLINFVVIRGALKLDLTISDYHV